MSSLEKKGEKNNIEFNKTATDVHHSSTLVDKVWFNNPSLDNEHRVDNKKSDSMRYIQRGQVQQAH